MGDLEKEYPDNTISEETRQMFANNFEAVQGKAVKAILDSLIVPPAPKVPVHKILCEELERIAAEYPGQHFDQIVIRQAIKFLEVL